MTTTSDHVLMSYVEQHRRSPRNRTQSKIRQTRLSFYKRKLIEIEGETRANKLITSTLYALKMIKA
jgi:hypothetical protein